MSGKQGFLVPCWDPWILQMQQPVPAPICDADIQSEEDAVYCRCSRITQAPDRPVFELVVLKHMAQTRFSSPHSRMALPVPQLDQFLRVSLELALTLACSPILSRLDYCNAVLHGAPASSIQKLQRVQNTATRVVLQSARPSPSQPLLQQLHWLPVWQCIDYKLAVLAYKIHHTSTQSTSAVTFSLAPSLVAFTLLPCHESANRLPNRLPEPTSLTALFAAPLLLFGIYIVDCSTLPIFKHNLKTFLFWHAFSS